VNGFKYGVGEYVDYAKSGTYIGDLVNWYITYKKV
jgi:hypothetical protein